MRVRKRTYQGTDILETDLRDRGRLFQEAIEGLPRACGAIISAPKSGVGRASELRRVAPFASHDPSSSALGKLVAIEPGLARVWQSHADGRIERVWCGNSTGSAVLQLAETGASSFLVEGPGNEVARVSGRGGRSRDSKEERSMSSEGPRHAGQLALWPVIGIAATEGIDTNRAKEVRERLVEDFGFYQPLQVTALQGKKLLLDGHNRLEAARQLRLDFVPVQNHAAESIDVGTWVLTAATSVPIGNGLREVSETEFVAEVDNFGGVISGGAHALFSGGESERIEAQHQTVRALVEQDGTALTRFDDSQRQTRRQWWRHLPVPELTRSLVVFPRVNLDRFLEVLARGQTVAPGATRFRLTKVRFRRPLDLDLFRGPDLNVAARRFAEAVSHIGFSLEASI